MSHSDELDALAATPPILAYLLAGNPHGKPSGDEGWTPREIVAHLRDCEHFLIARCQAMLSQGMPLLAAFDQEELARAGGYRTSDPVASLARFSELRAQTLALLSGITDEGWLRPGQHEETGAITVESLVRHMISHDLVHLQQIVASIA